MSTTEHLGGRDVQVGDSEHGHIEHREPWVERHWSWLVIAFGVIFVTCIDLFHPSW